MILGYNTFGIPSGPRRGLRTKESRPLKIFPTSKLRLG